MSSAGIQSDLTCSDGGCLLLGKTNLDEFAMGSGTVDSQAGPCRNIWGSGVSYDLRDRLTGRLVARHEPTPDWTVAGGSSGGSAVAVARLAGRDGLEM